MIDKSQVLSFVKAEGPLLPRDIGKKFGKDTFIAGAVLSQLVDNKELRISYAKIGGSPVYYAAGQEEKLQMLYKFLPGKEKEAYDLLKAKQIIRDSEAEPAIRVALRSIKDFAKAFEVNLPATKEIFWKWYLLPNTEAEQKIRQYFTPKTTYQENRQEEKQEKKTLLLPGSEQKKIQEKEETQEAGQIKKSHAEKKEEERQKEETPQTEGPQETEPDKETGFMEKIRNIFEERGIEILYTEILRKNTDIEMIINIPSPVGKLKYFCKAKDKKKSSDKELSSLFVQSQMKKLPVLYVTTGDLTKKAKEMLASEFKIISVLQI